MGGTTTLGDCLVALGQLLRPGALIQGPQIRAFEEELAQHIGVRHAFTFATGRVGLYGVLRALGVGAGDEVLVPVPTHIVVANAVRYTGAQPVFVDCRLGDYNIDLERAERQVTPRTRAIVLQHTFGCPVELDGALDLAHRHGLEVIEDCVHALGGTYRGRPLGSFGRAAFFSTEETKIISSTMGGVVATDDAALADKLRAFQQACEWPSSRLIARYLIKLVVYHLLTQPNVHGFARPLYDFLGRRHPFPQPTSTAEQRGKREPGYERRLSNAQAAVARRQLRRLQQNVEHRRRIARIYQARLRGTDCGVPRMVDHAEPAFVRYPVWVEDRAEAIERARPAAVIGQWFNSVLSESRHPSDAGYRPGSCPNAESAARHLINLPTHLRVSEEEARRIAGLVSGGSGAGNRGGDPRVLVVTITPYPLDARIQREVRTLASAGYRVTVICAAIGGEPAEGAAAGVEVLRFRNPLLATHDARVTTSARSSPHRRRRLRVRGPLGYLLAWGGSTAAACALSVRAMSRGGFDVVHVHNPPDTLGIALAVYKLLGKRLVYDHHDLTPEMYDARARGSGSRRLVAVLELLERWSCRLADHVIATNESYRGMDMSRGGVAPERITVVRNGPDLESLATASPDPQIRALGDCIVGCAGVMGPQDGVDHLLRAMRHLVFDHGRRDVICVLIGAGDAWEELQRLTDSLQLRANVSFRGWLPRAAAMRAIAAIDIGVEPAPSNPYNDRSTMVKVMEYMALRKPVVAFDLPENRYSAQGAAVYARPNDDRDLARAMAALIDDPARRVEMGELGRRRVEQRLAWTHSAEQLLAAYQAIAPRRVAPGWPR